MVHSRERLDISGDHLPMPNRPTLNNQKDARRYVKSLYGFIKKHESSDVGQNYWGSTGYGQLLAQGTSSDTGLKVEIIDNLEKGKSREWLKIRVRGFRAGSDGPPPFFELYQISREGDIRHSVVDPQDGQYKIRPGIDHMESPEDLLALDEILRDTRLSTVYNWENTSLES